MPHAPSLRFAAHSALGLREAQEDAFLAAPELGLFAVADAMGAMTSGRHAADLALATLRDHLAPRASIPSTAALRNAVSAASAAVFARTEAARLDAERRRLDPSCEGDPALLGWRGSGTTLVALLLAHEGEARAAIAHTGDSRAYRLRDGVLTPLTIDHRLTDDARRAGLSETAIAALPTGVIVEALGMRAAPRIELLAIPIEPGDLFLLCTDGLTDALDHEAIAALLLANQGDLPLAARTLVERATEQGRDPRHKGPSVGDNTTVLLVQPDP